MSGLTINNPAQFAEALKSKRIYPGDKIHLMDGVYLGDWTVPWTGTQAAPITVDALHPGKVTIDGSLVIGAWQTWSELDFTDRRPADTTPTPGIDMSKAGTRLIGCIIRGMRSSGVNWFGSGVGAVLECIIEDCGYTQADGGHGHAIYTHNNGGGKREIARCYFGQQIGKYSLHVYSGGSNYLRDYHIHDNLITYRVHVGGGMGLVDCLYERNIQYGNGQFHFQFGRYNLPGTVDSGTVRNNVMIDAESVVVTDPEELTITNNLSYGTAFGTLPTGFTDTPKPAKLDYWIPFSLSRRWAGIRAAYANGQFASSVEPLQ